MAGVRHARTVEPLRGVDFGAWSPSTRGYRRIGDLAAGGMGTVSLCVKHAGRFEGLYAVTRLHPHLRRDDAMRRMFLDEARVAGLVRHANVVSVLDVGEDDEGPFLVMDYVEGTSLSRFIRHHVAAATPIPVAVCAQIVAQAARGLHAAHELVDSDGRALHLVHRDVSPANILLGRDGIVRVTDFGVAKALGRSTHTSTGLLKGKVGYMSPEHLRFETLDRRTDLFALGVVLVEALTNRRLYSAPDAAAAARRVLHEPPPDIGDERPDVPPALVELSYELLAKNPDDRPATAADVADRLDEIVAELGHADVAGYLEATMGAEISQQRAELRRLAQRLEQEPSVAGIVAGAAAVTEVVGEPRRRARRWIGIAALGGAALMAAGVVGIWTATGGSVPLADVAVAVTEAAPAPPLALTHVDVSSRPPGASVRIDDRDVGTTPVQLELPANPDGVTLTLSLDGYETQSHDLVPLRNERLLVTLVPAREGSVPVGEPPPVPAPQADGDDDPRSRRSSRSRKGQARSKSSARPGKAVDTATEPERPRFRRFD